MRPLINQEFILLDYRWVKIFKICFEGGKSYFKTRYMAGILLPLPIPPLSSISNHSPLDFLTLCQQSPFYIEGHHHPNRFQSSLINLVNLALPPPMWRSVNPSGPEAYRARGQNTAQSYNELSRSSYSVYAPLR